MGRVVRWVCVCKSEGVYDRLVLVGVWGRRSRYDRLISW
jgi:hypothetical protein